MKQNLEKLAGLPIALSNARLIFKGPLSESKRDHQVRTLEEVRPYLRDQQIDSGLTEIYLIYRGVNLPADGDLLIKHRLRYDLTIIFPGRLGLEFPKTIGHYHELKPGTNLSYPEIYEIISGKAYFLFQRIQDGDRAEEVYLIEAAPGEKVIVPPGFGHITINAGSKPLVIANVFPIGVNSIYDFFKSHRGAAYYILAKAGKNFTAEKNNHYRSIGKLECRKPKKTLAALKLNLAMPLYASVRGNIKGFEFLLNPENFKAELEPAKLFD